MTTKADTGGGAAVLGDVDTRGGDFVGGNQLKLTLIGDIDATATIAFKARELGRKDLAGKTGTTNDQRDAWFNGFNEHLVANAWVGFDDNSKLGRGEVGGRAALPAWMDFMRVALKDVPDEEPKMPPGIVTVRIDPATGAKASEATEGAIYEMFREEDAPGSSSGVGDAGRQGNPVVSPPAARDLF